MEEHDNNIRARHRPLLAHLIPMCMTGLVVNLAGAWIVSLLHLPLYLDSVGTILISALGGYLPGIMTGLVTNLIKDIADPTAVYYGTSNVLIAICSAWFAKKGALQKPPLLAAMVIVLTLVGGVLGFGITWLLYGGAYEESLAQAFMVGGFSRFDASFAADYVADLFDKSVSVLLVVGCIHLMPKELVERLRLSGWQQEPLSEKSQQELRQIKCRGMSLRLKIMGLLVGTSALIALAITGISFIQYRNTTIDEHIRLGQGIAGLVASVIDAERVDEYLTEGDGAAGYQETERRLYSIMDSSEDIVYIYAFRILEDGCHVVFDLDQEDDEGFEPGSVQPFESSFERYLPSLLAGKPIEPVVSNGAYGWLLTVYQPVYNGDGDCVCYAATDISMERLRDNELDYLARLVSLCFGFFVLIFAAGAWLAEYNIVLPVNTMAYAMDAFAYNSEEERDESVVRIRGLDIHTGDEVENLYRAVCKTTEESTSYMEELHDKTDMIQQMQSGLTMVLADMVESRDKNTGQHVRKTAAYVKIILEQMKKEGIYADRLTDKFIEDVEQSAPLHDVGKINIPDAVLNKPGKLTDEEFAKMKTHTTAGRDIITSVIENIPAPGYLEEARNLAAHHHERWDGRGYPDGIAGEEIPLSARIMAVADVFDALVSRRSYKKGFPFDKAIDIIREGSGTQFDPLVVHAFLQAEDKVRQVARSFGRLEEEETEDMGMHTIEG